MTDLTYVNHPFRSVDAQTGESFGPDVPINNESDVAQACAAAEAAFNVYRESGVEERGVFLERIAGEIEKSGNDLVEMAVRESGLPRARIEGERSRTTGQLRLFANVLRRADWMGLRVDPAQPARTPLPRPDLRLRMIPLGPVAVFGASNFPLAFSTAGGDTAAALAAGCPVLLKGHPAHPGTDSMVAAAIQEAARACGMPNGVFTHLRGPGNDLGATLVRDPRVAAVAFTGSRGGGLALLRIAQQRDVPIPVFAEMSSVNPVLLMPHALQARAASIASGYVASLTLGAGQFCTNPGLVLAIEGEPLQTFIDAVSTALAGQGASTMLTRGIHEAYTHGVESLVSHPAVSILGQGRAGTGFAQARPVVLACSAADFRADPRLAREIFGPAALLIRARDKSELSALLLELEGQLTITLQMDAGDEALASELLPLLERKAGRIVANGWPTGVEVAHAMVHGGPYPATTDGRATSVGSLAINRFLRPVAYQNLPMPVLPPVLRDDALRNLPRVVDGERQ
jgi:alpha-ketoglutaric semialdehyde dehydrogenase